MPSPADRVGSRSSASVSDASGPDPELRLPLASTECKRTPARRGVSVAVMNLWLDSFLMLDTVLLGMVSAVLRIVFPAPTVADGWSLWGWTSDQWYDVQFGCLCVLGIGAVAHVTLHWNWVCGVVSTQILRVRGRTHESMKTIYGVGLLIALLHLMAAVVIAAMFCVQRPSGHAPAHQPSVTGHP